MAHAKARFWSWLEPVCCEFARDADRKRTRRGGLARRVALHRTEPQTLIRFRAKAQLTKSMISPKRQGQDLTLTFLYVPNTLDISLSSLHAKIWIPKPEILNPQPSILHPLPSSLNPQPSTLNPQPSTLNLQPSIPNSPPSTLSPQPSTLKSQP